MLGNHISRDHIKIATYPGCRLRVSQHGKVTPMGKFNSSQRIYCYPRDRQDCCSMQLLPCFACLSYNYLCAMS